MTPKSIAGTRKGPNTPARSRKYAENPARQPGEVVVDAQPLVDEEHAQGSGDSAQRGRRRDELEEQGQCQERDTDRDQHRPPQFLVGEELLEQVVGGLDVTGLPDDDAVDGVDADAALDDGDQPFVVGAVDHDHRGVRVVLFDQRLGLAGDFAVAPDGVAAAADDRDDGVVALRFEVVGDAEPLQQAVDAAVLGVDDTGLRYRRLDGSPPHHRTPVGHRAIPVDTHHQRCHSGAQTGAR